MAQTYQARFVDEGISIEHTPGAAVDAGDVVVQGSLIGVAKTPIAISTLGALALSGTYNVVKITGALSAGDVVYWKSDGDPAGGSAGTGALTASAGGNTFFGFCVLDAASAAEFVRVYLFPPVSVTSYNATDNPIADPGDAGAIPVTLSGSCQLVSIAGETRTIADPTIVGQVISISLKTDGGDVVLTVASPYNQAGDTTITFDDVGDSVTLIAVQDGADIEWRVLGSDGTTADHERLQNVIADPGDGNAIPVIHSGYVPLVTTGGETRTIADPSFVGQVIALSLKTDGGDCVITSASPVNQRGDTTITFDDIGDSCVLVAVEDGSDIEWRVLQSDGTTVDIESVANVITDPGSGGAIPVIHSGTLALVTGGAEARSLADPTFIGQLLNIGFHTDGGNATITAASDINQNGDNIMLMEDVGDHVLLIGSPDGADIEWRLVVNDGATLS